MLLLLLITLLLTCYFVINNICVHKLFFIGLKLPQNNNKIMVDLEELEEKKKRMKKRKK